VPHERLRENQTRGKLNERRQETEKQKQRENNN
jgi:hypothetical protein